MQAAVNRLPNRKTGRQGENHHVKAHLATGDDAALLGALPIAAAVIGNQDGCLKVLDYNDRFMQTVELSTCKAIDWNDEDCLKDDMIAEVLRDFSTDFSYPRELALRDSEGVSARYFELKLAPLQQRKGSFPRCL